MKILAVCFPLCLLLLSHPVSARHATTHYAYARVLAVQPVYRQSVRHVETCYHDAVAHRRHARDSNAIVPLMTGAVVGGAIVNATGPKRRAKQREIIAGAVVGGVIADRIIERRQNRRQRVAINGNRQCVRTQETHHGQQLQGYQVTYRYRGQEFSTFTRQHPGKRIRLAVNLTPVVYNP